MQDFRNLTVWQKSHQVTLEVYRITQSFPKEEKFGITSQLRRATSSIPANIAEGCGRGTTNELRRFLQIAMGSGSEVEYFLILSKDLEYIDPIAYEQLNQRLGEVKRMLNSFIQTLNSKSG